MDKRCKLTNEQIEEIQVLSSQGVSSVELGRRYSVNHTTILWHLSPEIKEKKREANKLRMREKYGFKPKKLLKEPLKNVFFKDNSKHQIQNLVIKTGSVYQDYLEKMKKPTRLLEIYKHKIKF